MPGNAVTTDDDEGLKRELTLIRERIVHALEIFPFLSRSMVHMAIGTSTSTGLWQPILEQLVQEGLVKTTEVFAKTPLDRSQSYTIYHLATNNYTPANDRITAQTK